MSPEQALSAACSGNKLLGVAALSRAFLTPSALQQICQILQYRLNNNRKDAYAMLDLSISAHLLGDADARIRLQNEAFSVQRLYSLAAPQQSHLARLLVIVTPGDFMANTPVEFLVEDGAVAVDLLFAVPGEALPQPLPEHAAAFIAVAEGDSNRAALEALEIATADWPRPPLNRPLSIARLTRDGAYRLLDRTPGLDYPANASASRSQLDLIARDEMRVGALLDGADYPILARPRGTHAGEGLEKIDTPAALASFLTKTDATNFYVTDFVDYRSRDSLFRKYRIVLIDGVPYAGHLAVSHHWMVHYLNADMHDGRNRTEEAEFFVRFDDFARRHSDALAEIIRRVELDYFVMDCAETADGRLLMFEIGTAMIVHGLDCPTTYPYKQPKMRKVADAFTACVCGRARHSVDN